jgi:hypothetical protein
MPGSSRLAVISIASLFCYYEIYRWIPLGPWNGEFHWPVSNDQFYPDIVIGLLLLLMIWSFRRQRIVGMWIGVMLLTLWLGVHLSEWWIPYVRGTGPDRDSFYHFYGYHTQILPVIGSHRPPDGGHAILDLFVLLAFAFCFVAAFANSRGRRQAKKS